MGHDRGLTREAVGDLREERLVQVSRLLQLDALLVRTLPDGEMARLPLDEVAAAIGDAVDELRPQVIIGHDPRGVNAHPDHIATHWAIRHTLLGRRGIRFAMLAYSPSTAEAAKPRLLFPTPDEEIDAVVHLSEEEANAKEAALRIHEAMITLRSDGDPDLIRRPPVERYDFLAESMPEPVGDLFAGLA
jgi:LmbE family N-acetylglucosaminyl deacetylase